MSSFSHYLEERIYRWLVLAQAMPTAPVAVYLGLSTADPTDDGSGLAEPGSAYARQSVTFAAPQSTVGQGTKGANTGVVLFPTASGGDWGSITHGALFDAPTGGNMLCHWAWTAPRQIDNGDTWVCAIGDLEMVIR